MDEMVYSSCPQLMFGEKAVSCSTEAFLMVKDSRKEGNEVDYWVPDAAVHREKKLKEYTKCSPEQNELSASADNLNTIGGDAEDNDVCVIHDGVQVLAISADFTGEMVTSPQMCLCNPETSGDTKCDDAVLPRDRHQTTVGDSISPNVQVFSIEDYLYKESSSYSVETPECLYSAGPVEVMDLEENSKITSANPFPETTCADSLSEITGQVTMVERDTELTGPAISDSNLPLSDQHSTPATTSQCPGLLAQDYDDIYQSDPENRDEEEVVDYFPDVMGAPTVSRVIDGVQHSVPYIDYRDTLHPYVPSYIEECWLTDTPEGQYQKVLLHESLQCTEPTAGYGENREKWSTGETVPTSEEIMLKTLYKEEPSEDLDTEHNSLKQVPTLRSFTDSAVQTDCVTVDAEVGTDKDIEKYMNEVTAEREILKERYQEVLDRQIQMENQLQVKVRQLQQRQEEEENIYQDNVKQVQEMKVKLEELKKKSEKEKKEFVQKEEELKNEVTRLYENGKRLMKEQEEKGNLIAILISDQSDKREKLNEDLAKLRLKNQDLNKKVLEETERALKAEVQSLENKREFAVMMLDKAANEAELQICSLSSVPGSSSLVHDWRRRLHDIQVQKENIKNQYEGHIQLVKNGAKLSSLPHIQLPTIPPAPAEPELVLQRMQQNPRVPFTNLPSTAPFYPAPGSLMNLPATQFTPSHMAQSEVGSHNTQPASNPATKLEKLLEKLEAKFPNCSRVQLTHILQQIKNSRGTIAGLSVDELTHQMAAQLTEIKQAEPVHLLRIPTTLSGHFPPAASQTSPYLTQLKSRTGAQASYQESPVLVSGSPRLCLMCQKVVLIDEVQPMVCSHIVHRECIKFWSQSNKNSSCPFCPTPR
ncbi:RING finger protein 214 isoform X3 [Rhincodon typus]|uniref:RING finger protein 214 isoform X3 n=1 Tax=Rhincodon typus TaxID=259920 RepID=UPI00202F5EB8|nr:RING finger protein 214 isoform X3 [Rhincodon typus]